MQFEIVVALANVNPDDLIRSNISSTVDPQSIAFSIFTARDLDEVSKKVLGISLDEFTSAFR
jgi:hypothetical protein